MDDGKQVSNNQILMVWDGASSGTVFKSSEGIIGSTLAAFKFDNSTLDGEFAYYFLSHFEDRISELAEGTGISHVPRDFTQIFQILKPPLPQQCRIADILSTVDEQIQQTNEIIDAKQDLVQGLINRLVKTGVQNTPDTYKFKSALRKSASRLIGTSSASTSWSPMKPMLYEQGRLEAS